jgi:hypothetical protein
MKVFEVSQDLPIFAHLPGDVPRQHVAAGQINQIALSPVVEVNELKPFFILTNQIAGSDKLGSANR